MAIFFKMVIDKIKKRNGQIVDFDRSRIEKAVEKAFLANETSIPTDIIGFITDDVIKELEITFAEATPGVENVQDLVEKYISQRGYLEVAKSYAQYRQSHTKAREEKKEILLEKAKRHQIKVVKRNGQIAAFDVAEIKNALERYAKDLASAVDLDDVLDRLSIYDGMTTKEINKALILTLRGKIEEDPIYSRFAAKILFNDLYKEVFGMDELDSRFSEIYREKFPEKLTLGADCCRLNPELLEFDLKKLSAALRPERDHLLKYLGAQTLYDRYLLKSPEQKIIEAPQYFWMRVAMGLALKEINREEKAVEFYNIMSELHYLPSTPTLFHSGTSHSQMSSCYLSTVEDDLKGIFKMITDNAMLSKWSGGLGNDWSNIRGTGALIKSSNVTSQGVIPFLKIVDSATGAINRSGQRRGATCVYLETWHYDIEDFIELRRNTGDDRRRTHDTNTANWIPDLFIKRVLADGGWTLFSPDETPELHHLYGKTFEEKYEQYEQKAAAGEIKLYRKLRARDLWKKMLTMLFETGHPWMTFKDPCNIRSPQDHVGVVHSSNLCTEITLNTSAEEIAVCNLGSINLSRHLNQGKLNWEQLAETVRTAMRMLDNVIDLNFYPVKEAETSNFRHRPVGLGIMGLQDALYRLNLPFDSLEAVEFSDSAMEFISYHAFLTSSELAEERGAYSTFQGSKWDRGIFPLDTLDLLEKERGMKIDVSRDKKMDWQPVYDQVKKYGMRNSNCLAIAPTATIANIAGCLPAIEPIYKNVYTKSNFSGEFVITNEDLIQDLKELHLWNKDLLEKIKFYDGNLKHIQEIPAQLREKYKEVFDIDPKWLIRHAAYRGKWIDQSQSLNLFTNSASGNFISEIYFYAWKMGLKTTYYLRTLGATAIEKSTVDILKKYDEHISQIPKPKIETIGEVCESCQ